MVSIIWVLVSVVIVVAVAAALACARELLGCCCCVAVSAAICSRIRRQCFSFVRYSLPFRSAGFLG